MSAFWSTAGRYGCNAACRFRDRPVFFAARVFLGCVFVYASIDKIAHSDAFAQAVFNYHILPDSLINLTAIVLPWLELLLGLCLIAGFWTPGAVAIGAFLLCVFTGALVFNLIRGLDVRCGCFSTDLSQDPASLLTVFRDAVLLLPAAYLTVRVFFHDPGGGQVTHR